VFTARYGLIPYIKQITFSIWKIKRLRNIFLRAKSSGLRSDQPHADVNVTVTVKWLNLIILREVNVPAK